MKLTTRDFDILRFLAAQGVATSKQIREKFFPSRTSCDLRLHILKSANLVEAYPAVREFKQLKPDLSELLGTGSPDLWKYRIYGLGAKFKNRRLGSDMIAESKMWKHQLQLNRMRMYCEKLFPGYMILTDPDIKQEWSRIGGAYDVVIPDLVVRGKGHEIAIEYERTLKAARIYFDRFQSYRRSSYTHVIYFCETELIFKKVSALSSHFRKIGTTNLLMSDMVFQEQIGFQSLEGFLTTADTTK